MNKDTGAEWTKHWGLASKLDLGFARVDAKAYTSPEVFAAEREKIFRKTWICVGRDDEVPNPGDYIKREIYPLEAEAIIARGKDGVVRAFHNACRHRGTALVREKCGNANGFVCPYHAWAYGLDGKLRAIPGAEYFPHVDRKTMTLVPIHLEIWNGFIFLNFDEAPAPLADYLGGLATLYDDLPFSDYQLSFEMTLDVDANWKTLVEASSEGYHVAVLHKWSVGDQATTRENPHNNFYDPIISPPHISTTVQGNHEYKLMHPVLQYVYAADAEASKGAQPFGTHKSMNRVGLPAAALENIILFPFTVLQLLHNRYIWFQYWPVGPNKTRFVFRAYAPYTPSTYREAFLQAHTIALTRDIVTEDGCMVKTQQRGFKANALSDVVLGENEYVLRYFHKMVQQYLSA
jgi:phenylpropionate dioxygenase-like ring-hydroxylating dioxygenase large terminal subunit